MTGRTFSVAIVLAAFTMGYSMSAAAEKPSALDFKMTTIEGKDAALSAYRGKVVLIVNVASKCGLTPQYKGLEAVYQKYGAKGLVILGFPANNFGAQEPGTNEEIKQFCSATYGVTFPMFSKISVKGADIHPLYAFLTGEKTNPGFSGDIAWNFAKFLLDRSGAVIRRFDPKTTPESEAIVNAIEAALAWK